MRIKVSEFRKVVREEAEKLHEIYGSSHLRDRDMESQRSYLMGRRGARGQDWEFAPEDSVRLTPLTSDKLRAGMGSLRNSLKNVAAAKSNFNAKWYGTLCSSTYGHHMAELTMDLGESLTALATALGMNLKIEGLNHLNSPRLDELNLATRYLRQNAKGSNGETLVPADRQGETPNLATRLFSKGSKSNGETLVPADRRGTSFKVIASALDHSKRAVASWLEAYDDFPRVRRFMCMGRAGDRFAQVLRKLDDVLLSL